MTRLILLDRDGVINRDSEAFVKSSAEFLPIDGSIDALADLHRAGFRIAVCTNQSAVGRGLIDEATLAAIHAELADRVTRAGGRIDGWRHCPHRPEDRCDCRKPKPGMLRALMAELGGRPETTVFVGDSLRDMQAARAAPCRAVLVRTGNGAAHEDAVRGLGVAEVYDDLRAFARAEISRVARGESA